MRYVPHWLITTLIVIGVIIIVAFIVGALASVLGGLDWAIHIGHFHWDVGVTKGGGG